MPITKFDHTFETYAEKRVSYIVPTKNHAEKLDAALTRCRAFVEPEDELIIMDGGSGDHTKEVVAKHHDIVDVFISEPDRHPAYASKGFKGEPVKDPGNAVNKGILLARGKYIKTIADDDIYHPEGMRQAVAILEAHPEVDLLMCGGTRERGGRVEYVYMPPGINYGKSAEDIFVYGRGCGVGHFFRRSAIANAGLHPPTVVRRGGEIVINPDAEYILKFIQSGAVVKFCRINAFHSPWSHYGEYDVTVSTDRYWRNAARRYCSRRFYVQYLISRICAESNMINKFLYVRKLIRHRIPTIFLQKLLGKKKKFSEKDIVWDGGFS